MNIFSFLHSRRAVQTKKVFKAKGFTLIEMMVSVAIFALVATAGLVAILAIIDAGEKAQSTNEVMSNLNTALETMARTIRTGTSYSCGTTLGNGACVGGGGSSSMTFVPADSSQGIWITYSLSGGQIQEQSSNDSAPVAITASDVIIDTMTFQIIQTDSGGDIEQPRVLMVLHGHVETRAKNRVDFYLQTTMTQRAVQGV